MRKTEFLVFTKCFMILLLIFFTLLPSANANTSSSKNSIPIIKQSTNNKVAVFKRMSSNKESISIANKLLNDELYVNSIWPVYKFNGKLSWREDPYKDKTWIFYFQSLDMVGYLMNAYEQSHSQKYLDKAKWYIESWMAANPSPQKQASPYAWKDHSTANRIVNIIQFWQSYKDSKTYDRDFAEKLKNLLNKHGDFLANDKNYSKGTNHGIFQDRSLIELSLIFPEIGNSKAFYNVAMERLMEEVKNDVTPSGVHKEHSTDYHILVLNLFKGINSFLQQFNIIEPELTNCILKMEDYTADLSDPNGKLPSIGDSGSFNLYSLNPSTITSQRLRYVITKGKEGIKPKDDAVYQDGGIAIFRNGWGDNDPLYLLFNAAFHSTVHKQADDLSFILTYGKTDFFVDSGKYNYNSNDPYRNYFTSTFAHNTITVDKKSYPITNYQVNKSKIKTYKMSNEYSSVSASHTLYKGVIVNRTIIYLKNANSILIRDTVESNNTHTYTETFNIGKDIQIQKTGLRTFTLSSKLENKQVELIQLSKMNQIRQYYGSDNPISGWQSLVFNQKYPINQLQFTKTNNKRVELKYIINCNTKAGVSNYTVKSDQSNDRYTIVYKNGKYGHVNINK